MKIRTGFVSNSSSSSFIICYGHIVDEAKARAAIGDDKSIQIFTEEKLIEFIENSRWGSPLECDWCNVSVSMKKTGNPEQLHVLYENSGGAGDDDSDFCDVENDCWDMDYDVDFEDFSEAPMISRVFTEENGFANIQISCGAGRNG